jgi:hypothetical protein
VITIKRSDFTFGRALNLGFEEARGTFAVAISGHCVPVDEAWLDSLVSPLENHDIGVVYGRQIGDRKSRTSEQRMFEHLFPLHAPAWDGKIIGKNANSACKITTWRRVRFNENLPGIEDLDLSLRVLEFGQRSVYEPKACVYHHHLERNADVFRRFLREELALQIILNQIEETSFWQCVALALKQITGDLLVSLPSGKITRNWRGVFGFRISQYLAVYLATHSIENSSRISQLLLNILLRLVTRGAFNVETSNEYCVTMKILNPRIA